MADQAADIIVVGSGGAGLSAAAEAARLGRRVLVLEKSAKLGGTTAIAVGSLMASCTDMQRRAGVEDSPARHEAEIAALSAAMGLAENVELRRLLVENVPDTVNFLASIGVDFIGPMLQPPFRTRRFYQALPGGRAYVHRLTCHCRRLGVRFRRRARVDRLVVTDGRVAGVELESRGRRETLAARAVILASGDFSANREMRRSLMGEGADLLDPINPDATGDGQRMAAGDRREARTAGPTLRRRGSPKRASRRRRAAASSPCCRRGASSRGR